MGAPEQPSPSVHSSFPMMRHVLDSSQFCSIVPTLGSVWDQCGLVPIGKKVISLQSLCCCPQVGPATWAVGEVFPLDLIFPSPGCSCLYFYLTFLITSVKFYKHISEHLILFYKFLKPCFIFSTFCFLYYILNVSIHYNSFSLQNLMSNREFLNSVLHFFISRILAGSFQIYMVN